MSSVSPVGAVVFYISLVLLTNYILVALFMGTLLEKFQNKFIIIFGIVVELDTFVSIESKNLLIDFRVSMVNVNLSVDCLF